MRSIPFVLIFGFVLPASEYSLAANWIGKRIMPKSDQITLRMTGRAPGSVFNIQWPAVVKTIDGQWLWVEDEGGVSHPAVSGWIRSKDAVLIGEALDHANRHLTSGSSSGGLYWVRGIGWENAGEFNLAAKDYQEALRLRPSNSDARLGVARMLAKTSGYDQQKFLDANRAYPSSPRLHVHWGQALESAKQPDQAQAKYEEAARLHPNWRLPYYQLGKLAASRGDYSAALDKYEEAIRRDASFHLAHRDRASALLAMKEEKDALSRGLISALRACELCFFREAESLAVLAEAFDALEQFPDAVRYQQMAVEYAPVAAKRKHVDCWRKYAKKAGSLSNMVVTNETHRLQAENAREASGS